MLNGRFRDAKESRRRQRRTFRCELLEPRLVLTGDLCITEFMASNGQTLTDSFGDSSDWIELYNNSATPIDLSQYYLTDDAAELDKFALPDVSLAVAESIIVFASNRDLVTPGGEIHANFSLSANGEYLALTDLGENVVQDFGAAYPSQIQDISYGIEMFNAGTPSTLLAASSTVPMLIPDATNGPALGTSWIAPDFDDTTWTSATLPIGYDENSTYLPIINTTVPIGTVGSYLRMPFTLSSLNATSDLTLRVKYDDGFVAYLNGVQVEEDREPPSPTWQSTALSNHNDGEAVVFQDFDISQHQSLLQVGENVLAIHALNVSDGSTDYLFDVTLEGSQSGIVTPIDEGFLENATPGSGNGEAFDGFVSEVFFSLDHGFYNVPQTLALATPTPGAKIVYTTDGSDPTVDAGLNPTNGSIYMSPFSITQTTVVRAAAFDLNKVPSLSRGRSYLFTGDIVHQSSNNEPPGPEWPADGDATLNGADLDYGMDPAVLNTYGLQAVEDALKSISTISISTDLDNLFSSSTGIYSNAQNRGRGWERFSSVELIEPDGSAGFQVNAGLRIRGGFSRNDAFPKRSFRLFFRGEYGESKLEYDFFGDGADKFDVIDLRTSQNYAWSRSNDDRNTFLREVFGRDAQRDVDQTHTRSRYHHLYLNGVYWGLYQTQERVESYFGETYLGGDEADYDRLKNNNANGYRTEVADGDDSDWRLMFELAQDLADDPIGNADNYWTLQGRNSDGTRNLSLPVLLDVDNLIDYEMILFLTGGFDSGISNFLGNNKANNWVAIRNRVTDDRGFQFFIHDNEHSLGVSSNSNDRTGPYYSSNDDDLIWFNPGFLHQDLLVHEAYRLQFQDRVQKHFFNDGAFTAQNNVERVAEREVDVATAILAESMRWGDTHRNPAFTPTHWQNEVNDVKNWLLSRNNTVLNQLKNDGLHSTIAPVVYNQHGGVVNSGFGVSLSTTAAGGTIYYTTDGIDPRLPNGILNSGAVVFGANIPVFDTMTIQSRVRLNNGDWSALTEATFRLPATPADATNLRITEINYHPQDPTAAELAVVPSATSESFEYVEFMNISAADIDLTGVQISSLSYSFPATTLGAGQRAILARDRAAFAIRYSGIVTPVGEYGNADQLSDGGSLITISSASGSTIQSFTYDDNGNWPSWADGEGHTLEVKDENGDYNDPLNWLPSRTTFGSPGFHGTPGVSPSGLRITEVNYNPAAGGVEFVEIKNDSTNPISLTGVRLVEGVEFDFGSASISLLEPGEFAVIVGNVLSFQTVYGSGLPVAGAFSTGSLSNAGERVILFDQGGNIIHDFVYDDIPPWDVAADGAGSSLEIVSTNGSYSDASNWQPSSVTGGTPGSQGGSLACDYVGNGDGCDLDDLNALYASTNGAPAPLTDALILEWLVDASVAANPSKSDPDDTYVLGDLDLNGDVDSTDLGRLLNVFSDASGLGWGDGNLNSDAVVNSTDLGALLNNFGYRSFSTAATVVSTPTASARSVTRVPRAAQPITPESYSNGVVEGELDVETTVADEVVFVSQAISTYGTSQKTPLSVRDLVFGSFGEDEDD